MVIEGNGWSSDLSHCLSIKRVLIIAQVSLANNIIMTSLSHGTSQVSAQDGVIEARFIGSFNALGVQEYARKVKALVAGFDGAKFSMLIDNTGFEGGTPEAYQTLDSYNDWLNSQALIAKAFVIQSTMNRHILMQRTPALATQKVAFFTDINEARAWLKQQDDNV